MTLKSDKNGSKFRNQYIKTERMMSIIKTRKAENVRDGDAADG